MDSLPSEPPGKPKSTGEGRLSLLPGALPDPGIDLGSPALQMDSLPAELPGKPNKGYMPGKVLITLYPISHLNRHKN